MLKVHSHDQEYWVVQRTPCECGSTFDRAAVVAQRLERRPAGEVDVLDLQCEHCGRAHTLEFDISPFHGKPDTESFQQLVKDQQHVWHMFVWSELRMESVMDYLSKLAGNGDALAIEYIANAARHFLAIAESNHELDSRR